MFRIQAEIKGLSQFVRKLDVLKLSLRKKVLRSAMRKSASVVNKSGKAGAPVGATGMLKKSLGVKVKAYPSGVVLGVVEPRGGFRVAVPQGGTLVKVRYHNPRAIAHLVERGTRGRFTKSGKYTGAARAQPFLAPALIGNETKIMGIFADEIQAALAEAAK